MSANRQVGKAYLFFKSSNTSMSIKEQIRRIERMRPLVDLYLPGKTSLVKGDRELLKLCKKLDSRGFNQTLKIIIRDRPNFNAMVEMLVVTESMIKQNIINEGSFSFLAYKSKAKARRRYRKLQIPIPSQRQSA